MSLIEIVAAVSGLLCVILTIKEKVASWPIGLVQVGLYIYIFWSVKLYSDAMLQVFFVITSIYGWYKWLYGGEQHTELKVSAQNKKEFLKWIWICMTITPAWGIIMKNYLNAAAPIPDSFILVASIIATYLMAKKKLECWFYWISVDVIAIGVYFYKKLYITSGLYAIFLVLAIIGLKTWRKSHVKVLADTFNARRL